jgi:hypothetical protein
VKRNLGWNCLYLVQSVAACLIIGTTPVAWSQSKDEVDQFFERQSAALNADRSRHSTREVELIRAEYSRDRSTLGLFYKIDLGLTKNKLATKDEQIAMRVALAQAACTGSFAVFMRARNIRINHTYYENKSGRELATFEISKRDC